jgi:hypothetical protein
MEDPGSPGSYVSDSDSSRSHISETPTPPHLKRPRYNHSPILPFEAAPVSAPEEAAPEEAAPVSAPEEAVPEEAVTGDGDEELFRYFDKLLTECSTSDSTYTKPEDPKKFFVRLMSGAPDADDLYQILDGSKLPTDCCFDDWEYIFYLNGHFIGLGGLFRLFYTIVTEKPLAEEMRCIIQEDGLLEFFESILSFVKELEKDPGAEIPRHPVTPYQIMLFEGETHPHDVLIEEHTALKPVYSFITEQWTAITECEFWD